VYYLLYYCVIVAICQLYPSLSDKCVNEYETLCVFRSNARLPTARQALTACHTLTHKQYVTYSTDLQCPAVQRLIVSLGALLFRQSILSHVRVVCPSVCPSVCSAGSPIGSLISVCTYTGHVKTESRSVNTRRQRSLRPSPHCPVYLICRRRCCCCCRRRCCRHDSSLSLSIMLLSSCRRDCSRCSSSS